MEGEHPEYWESVMLLPSPSSLAKEEELEVGGERRSAWIKPADTEPPPLLVYKWCQGEAS